MKTRDWQDQKENRDRLLEAGDIVWYAGWGYDEPVAYEVIAVDKTSAALRAVSDGELCVHRRGELYADALICGRRVRDGAYKSAREHCKRAEEGYYHAVQRVQDAHKDLDATAADLLAKDKVKARKYKKMDIPTRAELFSLRCALKDFVELVEPTLLPTDLTAWKDVLERAKKALGDK